MDNRLRDVEIKMGAIAQRVDDHEGDMHRFAGLPLELAEIRHDLKSLKEGVNAAHEAIRAHSARLDKEHEERIQGQAERKQELEEARAERDKEIKRIEAERERQYMEIQERADQAKIESRRMLLGLMGIFLTAVSSVIVQLLGGPVS